MRQRTRASIAAASAVLLLMPALSRAGEFDEAEAGSEPAAAGMKFSGLLDARAFWTDRGISWLRGGPNMLRYGGLDTDSSGVGETRAAGVSVPQASIVFEAQVPQGAKIHIQGNFTTDASSGTGRIGIVEAYGEAGKSFGDDSIQLRAGGMIPKISWEHPDPAWSTRYTLTPSALASWVGEEMRVFGAELVWEHRIDPGDRLRVTAAGFTGGDQIGRLL